MPMQDTQVGALGREDPLEKEIIATHSSILAWKTWYSQEVPAGLQSVGSQELDTTQQLNYKRCQHRACEPQQ